MWTRFCMYCLFYRSSCYTKEMKWTPNVNLNLTAVAISFYVTELGHLNYQQSIYILILAFENDGLTRIPFSCPQWLRANLTWGLYRLVIMKGWCAFMRLMYRCWMGSGYQCPALELNLLLALMINEYNMAINVIVRPGIFTWIFYFLLRLMDTMWLLISLLSLEYLPGFSACSYG